MYKEYSNVYVNSHPLVQHKISMLRNKNTGTNEFRKLIEEIAMLMGYEALSDLPLEDVEIETPIETCMTPMIAGKKLAIVPVLRAGLGMVSGITALTPSAVNFIKQHGGKKIKFMCVIAAPEGIERLMKAHPDIQLYVGHVDRELNENAYICPGLGDAGDRIFGTK